MLTIENNDTHTTARSIMAEIRERQELRRHVARARTLIRASHDVACGGELATAEGAEAWLAVRALARAHVRQANVITRGMGT